MPNSLLVLCTCPKRPTALELATNLVELGVAACATLQAPVTSVYRWQGQIEQADECLLLVKTSRARYQDLENTIRARHPYELPEIIAVPIEQGLADYLLWIEQCTSVLS